MSKRKEGNVGVAGDGFEVEGEGDGLEGGKQVSVRENHAFGHPGAAAGVHDDGWGGRGGWDWRNLRVGGQALSGGYDIPEWNNLNIGRKSGRVCQLDLAT